MNQCSFKHPTILSAAIELVAACSLNQAAGSALTDAVVIGDVVHSLSLQRAPPHLFEVMSCKMALSKLRSATSFFSRAFSPDNGLGARKRSGPGLAYCFSQR